MGGRCRGGARQPSGVGLGAAAGAADVAGVSEAVLTLTRGSFPQYKC